MANSSGKDWEGNIRGLLDRPQNGISLDRLPDPMMGFKGVQNIADFKAFHKDVGELYIECKSTKEGTMNFSMVTENQWKGLLEKSKIPGVLGAVCVYFSSFEEVFLIDIEYLEYLRIEEGQKSFSLRKHLNDYNYQDGILCGYAKIDCVVPRVNPKVDLLSFVKAWKDLIGRKDNARSN